MFHGFFHDTCVAFAAQSQKIVVLSKNSRRAFAEIQSSCCCLTTEVIDIEHQVFIEIFTITENNPAEARGHQAKFVTGSVDGLHSWQAKVPFVIRVEERVDETSRGLSYLPLCHVYERTVNYILQYKGVSIYYAENMGTIVDNIQEVEPHIMTTVPRLLEKVYDKILSKGRKLTGIKKQLFFWSVNLGLKYQYDNNSPR